MTTAPTRRSAQAISRYIRASKQRILGRGREVGTDQSTLLLPIPIHDKYGASNMKTPDAHQKFSGNDLDWHLFGEYPLSMFATEFDKDPKFTLESILLTMCGSNLPIELSENIKTTLRSFCSEAQTLALPVCGKPPVRIRIFCQKKMLNKELRGGCGYFVLDRSRDSSNLDGKEQDYWIDIFLYKEGE